MKMKEEKSTWAEIQDLTVFRIEPVLIKATNIAGC